MPFTFEDFADLRPFLYHVTGAANPPVLARSRVLRPAADLIRHSGDTSLLGVQRLDPRRIVVGDDVIELRDQQPLNFANVVLPGGWLPSQFRAFLDEHVFFWPGTERGPIDAGKAMLIRYEGSGVATWRVRTSDVLRRNPELHPLFCAFNSGAPRMQNGRPVYRGPDIFQPAERFPRTRGKVVEVVFRGPVHLPNHIWMSTSDGWSTW